MRAFEITGKLKEIGKTIEGVSKKTGKDWKLQTFVIKPPDKYSSPVAFKMFNENDISKIVQVKDTVRVSFYPSSRQWKDKWYTELKAVSIESLTNSKEEIDFDEKNPPDDENSEDSEALPF